MFKIFSFIVYKGQMEDLANAVFLKVNTNFGILD